MMNKKEFFADVKDVSNIAVKRAKQYLDMLSLSLKIDWNYEEWEENGLSDAIGVYWSGSIFEGEIIIGFEINNLYKSVSTEIERHQWTDPYVIIDEAIQTNVFHEMGHGIVEWLTDYLQETDELDNLYDNNQQLFDSVLDNEEEAVEEFAWDFYDNQVENSKLGRIVKLYLNLYNNSIKESIENIPLDCGEFNKIYQKPINYNSFEYFGNCVNSWKIFGDATRMAGFINNCSIVNTNDVINKIKSGDKPLPKELINSINKLTVSKQIDNKELICCGIDDYQKIMWIYLTNTDKHYFFDCV